MRSGIIIPLVCIAYSAVCSADWCDGSKFLVWSMPWSERVAAAGEALQRLQPRLQEQARHMQLDSQRQGRQVGEELSSQYRLLSEQTVKLCQAASQNRFPVAYPGALLATTEEATAQIQLNLGLLQVQREAFQELAAWQLRLRHGMDALQNKEKEVAVLLRQFDFQKNGTVQQTEADSFLRNACLAIHQSQNLLHGDSAPTLDGLLAERLRHAAPVDPSYLKAFMVSCRLPEINGAYAKNGWLDNFVDKLKTWF